jgi:hypothetical protein
MKRRLRSRKTLSTRTGSLGNRTAHTRAASSAQNAAWHNHVFGARGYRFADFPKIGAPLNLILWIVASILIPIFWPFVPRP